MKRRRIGTLARIWIGVVSCVLVLGGCATPELVEPEVAPAPTDGFHTLGAVHRSDLTYPKQIGQYELLGVEDYDEVEMGVGLEYRDRVSPGFEIDVYVYPITKHELASLADVLEWEQEAVQHGIEAAAKQNGWVIEPAAGFILDPGIENLPAGFGSLRRIIVDGQPKLSFAFVAVRDHEFFKVRFKADEEPGVDLAEQFDNVVAVFYPAIHRKQPRPAPELRITVLADAVAAAGNQSCALVPWLAYGNEMIHQILSGHYMPTYERELAARGKLLESWNELRREHPDEACPNASHEALAAAARAGFFREYVFEAYDRGYWSPPEDLRREEFVEWANSTLSEHDPFRFPGVQVGWKEEAEPALGE
jgi:hypothetical protein